MPAHCVQPCTQVPVQLGHYLQSIKFFEFDLGYLWLLNFCKRIKDELTMKKTKLLSSGQCSWNILPHVAQFVADVQKLAAIIPMRACNIVNYNETRVWLS